MSNACLRHCNRLNSDSFQKHATCHIRLAPLDFSPRYQTQLYFQLSSAVFVLLLCFKKKAIFVAFSHCQYIKLSPHSVSIDPLLGIVYAGMDLTKDSDGDGL